MEVEVKIICDVTNNENYLWCYKYVAVLATYGHGVYIVCFPEVIFLIACLQNHGVKWSEVAQLCLTLWPHGLYQASLSMGFSRQEYWSG